MNHKVESFPQPLDEIRQLPRYSSAAAASTVMWRASSNESAIAPSPEVVRAICDAASRAHIYPSMTAAGLVSDLSKRLEVSPDEIVAGGGSIAVIQQTLLAYAGPGDEVIIAWRSYEAYPILIGVAGATSVRVPLNKAGGHDLTGMLNAITPRTKVIIVCTPNNPTGVEVPHEELVSFLDQVPPHILVILDEAYWEFRNERANDGVALNRTRPNVVTFRTFSKAYALAGLRVGFLVAHADIASTVRTASVPFGVNSIAEAAARTALADTNHIAAIAESVNFGRKHLSEALSAIGVKTYQSGGNFLWATVGSDARQLEAACNAEGVSVRAFEGEGLRVTVGNRDAEDAVIRAFTRFYRP